jgi:broad specificity phosphatase PhoE
MTTRILLIRHGESEGNVNPESYTEKGDWNIGLTDKGIEQAQCAGIFLREHFRQTTDKWPLFFVSGYRRPQETLSGAYAHFSDAFEGAPKEPYTDPRLSEQSFGGLNLLQKLAQQDSALGEHAYMQLQLSKAFIKTDPIKAKALFGESILETIANVKAFIDGSLQRDLDEGHDYIVIFAHGRVITSFLANWFHVPFDQLKSLKNPKNCDVIEISGEPKKWQARRIWDGENFAPANENPLAHIKPITWAGLPQIPEHLIIK